MTRSPEELMHKRSIYFPNAVVTCSPMINKSGERTEMSLTIHFSMRFSRSSGERAIAVRLSFFSTCQIRTSSGMVPFQNRSSNVMRPTAHKSQLNRSYSALRLKIAVTRVTYNSEVGNKIVRKFQKMRFIRIWWGVSVEDKEYGLARIPDLQSQ